MMYASFLIYVITALPIVSLMKIKQLPRYLCAFFITTLAEIILTGNILGLFHQLNNKTAWIIVQIIFLLFSWSLWLLTKPHNLFSIQFKKPNFHALHFFEKFSLILLCILVVIGYMFLMYLVVVVPPNNNDSMLVHLVRVGYWLQQGSFTPWNSIIERQVIYPYNAQIVVLWTILFQGTDLFAAFLQFFSALFTALGIYCIGREIGGSRFQSSIVALFYLTFPQVILQATTTQDDLVITCFLILGSYFFIRWYSKGYSKKNDLMLASLSLMIALGIKPTAFYYFIGFTFFILILLTINKMKFKHFYQIVISGFLAFMIFSSFAYIINTIYFHHPLGPSDFVNSESGVIHTNVFQKFKTNAGRFVYQFLSLDGLPTLLTKSIQNEKVYLASKLPEFFDTSLEFIKNPSKPFSLSSSPGINEDYSWFGPISFLLLIPAFFISVYKAIKSKILNIILLLVVPLFLGLAICVLRPGWDPYQGRYFNTGIALLMPLAVFLIKPNISNQIYVFLLSLLAILITLSSVFLNESKPLITQATIFRNLTSTDCDINFSRKLNCYISSTFPKYLLDRESILTLNTLQKQTFSSTFHYALFSEIPKIIPANSRIGLVLNIGDWEYPYFGRTFEYILFPVVDKQLLNNQFWLNQDNFDYLIIHKYQDESISIGSSFEVKEKIFGESENDYWLIYQKNE